VAGGALRDGKAAAAKILTTPAVLERNDVAVLYTGDVRTEPWFVNSLARHPVLVPYATGARRLQTLYLDTSNLYENALQTKAEGIRQLIGAMGQYPSDTIFFFWARTYGYGEPVAPSHARTCMLTGRLPRYEDAWIAIAKHFNTRIHVDPYTLSIYASLVRRTADGELVFTCPRSLATWWETRRIPAA
jgi:hypothetical protein